jgi:hypothetical protein
LISEGTVLADINFIDLINKKYNWEYEIIFVL